MPETRFHRLLLVAALASASALSQAPAAFALTALASGQVDTSQSTTNKSTTSQSTVSQAGVSPNASGGKAAGHALPGTENQHSQATPVLQQNQVQQAPAAEPAEPDATKPGAEPAAEAAPVVEIIHDMSKLPEPVRKLRQAIVEAAASGDVERMRPIMDPGAEKTDAPNENEDPIDTLKSFSGDPDGLEILAIMLDLLQTGAAHLEPGTPDEVYVWPYFVGKPLTTLTPPEKVELLRIITAGDLAAMEEVGNYNFYRVGISPDGKWKFIVSGD